MNKKYSPLIVLFFIIFFEAFCSAQSISPSVIATQGDYNNSSAGSISWTIGEIITETTTDSNHILTQGFQQPILKISLGKETHSSFINVNVFPNPVSDKLTIDFSSSVIGNYTLALFDVQGKLLYSEEFAVVNGSDNQLLLSFYNYASGIYLLNILDSEKKLKQSYKINKTN